MSKVFSIFASDSNLSPPKNIFFSSLYILHEEVPNYPVTLFPLLSHLSSQCHFTMQEYLSCFSLGPVLQGEEPSKTCPPAPKGSQETSSWFMAPCPQVGTTLLSKRSRLAKRGGCGATKHRSSHDQIMKPGHHLPSAISIGEGAPTWDSCQLRAKGSYLQRSHFHDSPSWLLHTVAFALWHRFSPLFTAEIKSNLC